MPRLAAGLCAGLLLLASSSLCAPQTVAEEPAALTDREALAEALRFAEAPLPPPSRQAAADAEAGAGARLTPQEEQLKQRLALLRAQLLEEPRRDVPAALRGYTELAARLEALLQAAAEQRLPGGWEAAGAAELAQLELPATAEVALLADAAFELAALRLTGLAGRLLPRDEPAGVQLLRAAAVGGSLEAHLALSARSLTGSGLPRDCEAAFAHGEAAAREFAAEVGAAGAFQPPLAPLLLRERWANADFRPPLPGPFAGGGGPGAGAGDDEWEQLQRQQLDVDFGGWAPDLRRLGGGGGGDELQALRRQAGGGDGEALFQLGYVVLRGVGTAPNATAARVLFQAARLQGEPAAHNALGVLAHEGRGRPPDAAAARRHFAAGAAAGDPDAMFNLGLTLQRGGPKEGGPEAQPEQALQHMLDANDAQQWQAPLELARMYHTGVGTPRNCSTAMLHLGTFLAERAPWHEQMLEAVEHLDAGDEWRALVSLASVAEQGCTAAQHNLAWALHTSKTFMLPERHSLAYDLFLRAGATGLLPMGLTDAAHLLWHGHKHQLPHGTNRTKALELWHEAMEQGDTEAAFHLAAAHQAGAGVRRNLSAAAELYRAAVRLAPAERFAAPPFLALQLLRLERAWRLAVRRAAAAAAAAAQRDLAVLSALASGLAGVLCLLWQRRRVRRERRASQH